MYAILSSAVARRVAAPILALSILTATGLAQVRGDRAAERNYMVNHYVAGSGVTNPSVLEALRAVPRHEFVPPADRDKAYLDMAIPIGESQTISPPFIVAFMTDKLDPKPTDRVLEIGTGSGYQASILGQIVQDVYSIEIVEPLGRRAAALIKRLGYDNIHTKIGDGFQGWPEHAPYDSIIVTCSPEKLPQPLIDQLKEGGRIVVPLGERFQQSLYLFRKVNGEMVPEPLEGTMFVPMTGKAEEQREVLPDITRPHLVNGGFEQATEGPAWPDGWYYIRQAQVERDEHAPEGDQVFAMRNSTPNNTAQALQAFGLDGRAVRSIRVSISARGSNIRAISGARSEPPALQVSFFTETRFPLAKRLIGNWRGTFDWKTDSVEIPVPLAARMVVIGVGLFGSTGELVVDNLTVEAEKTNPAAKR